MEKELKRQSLDLTEDGDKGTVKIADDVVAMIAALAATEVKGVASMYGDLTHELLYKIGYKNLAKGAKVEVYDKKVRVDISIIIKYGVKIPGTCQEVQTKVKNAIESMTGLEVTDVNVRIAGVDVQKTAE